MIFTTATSHPWVLHHTRAESEHIVEIVQFEETYQGPCPRDEDSICQRYVLKFTSDRECFTGARDVRVFFDAIYFEESNPHEVELPFQLSGSSIFDCADELQDFELTTETFVSHDEDNFVNPSDASSFLLGEPVYVQFIASSGVNTITGIDLVDVSITSASLPLAPICIDCENYSELNFERMESEQHELLFAFDLDSTLFSDLHAVSVQVMVDVLYGSGRRVRRSLNLKEQHKFMLQIDITNGERNVEKPGDLKEEIDNEIDEIEEEEETTYRPLESGSHSVVFSQTFNIDFSKIDCASAASIIRVANALALSLDTSRVDVLPDSTCLSNRRTLSQESSTFEIQINGISLSDALTLASFPRDQIRSTVLTMLPSSVQIAEMSEIEVVSEEDDIADDDVSTSNAGVVIIASAVAFVMIVAFGYWCLRRKESVPVDEPIEVISQ